MTEVLDPDAITIVNTVDSVWDSQCNRVRRRRKKPR